MIIKELKQPITDGDIIEKFKAGIYKIEDGLVIHFDTGTVWTFPVLVQGTAHDDLMEIVEEIAGHDILPEWSIGELEEMYGLDYESDDMVNILGDAFIAINGGATYTSTISHVEEI